MAGAVLCSLPPTAALCLRHGVLKPSAKGRKAALQPKIEPTPHHLPLSNSFGNQNCGVRAGPVRLQSTRTAHRHGKLPQSNCLSKPHELASETGVRLPQSNIPLKRRQVVTCGAAGKPDASSNLARNLELEPSTRGPRNQAGNQFNGIFLLLILNIGIYVADHLLHLPVMRSLYLNHVRPQWWQFVTSTFCHFNWNHLSSNLFFLYIFGKLVEEEEGSIGVWASYLVTGIGANVVSYLLLPHSSGGAAVASCGASGAVFGLFAISVLVKLSWNWRKILEVLILGQFVVEKVIAEAAMSARGTKGLLSGGINHVAHLAGALVGVALIYLITRLPEAVSKVTDKDLLE
ncbi:Rhomboid family proteins [Klebsormidium nitens]|uniref:Rhomboid family proteins n=1 Tax=Klebsormidium nitens TaxID=105231 RepID=A0A1Y1HVH4_KLENI|nr:Rhomboid family proteins [Klebsormidium nitens]|eukprot:GAQ79838.1 Rhomboid family proteins [Klebsormidium nitens]